MLHAILIIQLHCHMRLYRVGYNELHCDEVFCVIRSCWKHLEASNRIKFHIDLTVIWTCSVYPQLLPQCSFVSCLMGQS
jgi:hypothetical protein